MQADKPPSNSIEILKVSNISGKRRKLLPKKAADGSDMDSDSDSDSDEDEDEKGSGEPILQVSLLLVRIFMVYLLMVAIVHDIDYQYDGSCIHSFISYRAFFDICSCARWLIKAALIEYVPCHKILIFVLLGGIPVLCR